MKQECIEQITMKYDMFTLFLVKSLKVSLQHRLNVIKGK